MNESVIGVLGTFETEETTYLRVLVDWDLNLMIVDADFLLDL